MTRHLLLPLLLSPALANSQTPPEGHAPGHDGHHGFNLCDLTNDKMLVGEISMSQDSTLFAGFHTSTASMGKFSSGRTPDGVRRALLSFDVASVDWPADVKIACAEVRLAVDPSASVFSPLANGMTLHKVNTSWTTNGITDFDGNNPAEAQEGDATWKYSSYPNEEWDVPGGDYTADSLSRETIVNSADGIRYAYFGSTKRMHAIVNDWIVNPNINYGMLIKSDERANDPVAFNVYHGMENNPNLIPKLIVVYTAPSLGYEHEEQPAHHHHNPSNMPDLNGFLNMDNHGDKNTTTDLPSFPTGGNIDDGEGNNKPDLNGYFDEEGNWHQNGTSDYHPGPMTTDPPTPQPSTRPTNKHTPSPPSPTSTNTNNKPSAPNTRRTFPPISDKNSHHGESSSSSSHTTNTSTSMSKDSTTPHPYIIVAAVCTVASVVIMVVSVVWMRFGPHTQQQMTAEEVIGNDLSLQQDPDRELV